MKKKLHLLIDLKSIQTKTRIRRALLFISKNHSPSKLTTAKTFELIGGGKKPESRPF